MTDLRAGSLGIPGVKPADEDAGPSVLGDVDQSELEVRAARARARARAHGPKTQRVVAARPKLRYRLLELLRSRELFVFLVRKEIKVKYKNSFLGFLWSMLNPALTILVYFFVFQVVLKNGIPSFVIYLFSGLLAWNLFQTGVLSATSVVVGNAGIVKKVAFPREILALSSVGAAFMFFVFQSTVMIGFMLFLLHPPAWADLWLLIPGMAALLAFSAALAVFLSAVNVYFRDTQHLMEVLITAWFWAAPVVYSYANSIAPKFATHWAGFKIIYWANPLTPIVLTFQRVLYARGIYPTTHKSVLPNYSIGWYLASDLIVLAVSSILFLGAMVVFGRLEGNFAEEL
ncbi:MAG TPA: ABC transporter permease [Acidimicrobiales bacterium]|nr:ABC transporter permease [Acidimicrobiales bacterium]